VAQSKIFGIGLAKTGTTSLNDAFAILGIASIGCPASIAAIERFDAATDGIVADRFEELDRTFPNSKFIYTVRDPQSWLASYTRYHGRKQSPMPGHAAMRKHLYGTSGVNEQTLLDAYQRHEHHVFTYFRDRPQDLLVLNICSGQADWETLCAFLGKPAPAVPFPASNENFTDSIFLHLLHHLPDPALVAKITRAPLAYLNTLAVETYDPATLSREKPTKRADRILVKSCKQLGGVAAAAQRLHLEERFLQAAIVRHKQRKAGRIRRKSTFLEKRLRRLRQQFRLQSR
jgi:hypothetical protein